MSLQKTSPGRFSSRWLPVIAGAAFGIALWSLIALANPTGYTRVPSPLAVGAAFWQDLVNGSLLIESAKSMARVFGGFLLAAAVGVPLGLLCGTYLRLRQLVGPTNTFLRYVPPTAFSTLLIVYFGIGEKFKVLAIVVGVFFFITQMVIDAVSAVDRRYFEMAQVAGMRRQSLLRYLVIPAVSPSLIDILRINLSGAWTLLIAVEVIGADGGLGHMMAVGQRFGRIEAVYEAILALGLIGLLTDLALQRLRPILFPWYRLIVR